MTTESVRDAIQDGISMAYKNPEEYDAPHYTSWGSHPNATLELAEMKTFSIGRQTMDPNKGDKGFIRFVVRAVNGPAARQMVDEMCAEINAPFRDFRPERAPKSAR